MQELGGPCQEKLAESGVLEALLDGLLRSDNLPQEDRPALPADTAAWCVCVCIYVYLYAPEIA